MQLYSRDRKGSSVKVQIYSPFILINKTGLPFSIRSTTRMSISPRDVAGDTRPGTIVEETALLQLIHQIEELSKSTPFRM